MTLLRALSLAALLAFPGVARAADCAEPAPAPAVSAADARRLPPDVTRAQKLALPDRCLAFHTIAGAIAPADGVEIGYVAYLADGADPARRPVIFAVNGGPGAGSAWLQIGALGPWRLPMADLRPSSPPALVANADTWLDFADLVFLDPPGTGYSLPRTAGEAAKADVWSVDGDNRALAETIRRWLADHGRLGSPKFIVGESYGGFRAPRLAKRLAADLGVGVNGVILVSPVLDFAALSHDPANLYRYVARLPSYAAAAREAKGPVSRADLAGVEAYARGEYLADWLAGPRDPAAVARRVAHVAALAGLPEEVVRKYGGDLDERDFLYERGLAEGRKLASYDATLSAGETGPDWPDAEDPVLPGFVPAFTGAMTTLYREKLGWRVEDQYEVLNGAVGREWNWHAPRTPEALGDLSQQLALDSRFRVLIGHGLTDVTAPYFATALELARLPPFAAPERLTLSVYPGGHMFYSRDGSRKAFREDARRLIEGVAGG